MRGRVCKESQSRIKVKFVDVIRIRRCLQQPNGHEMDLSGELVLSSLHWNELILLLHCASTEYLVAPGE